MTFQPWKHEIYEKMKAIMAMLQWGHDFSATETWVEETDIAGLFPLQWGHGFSTMETSDFDVQKGTALN